MNVSQQTQRRHSRLSDFGAFQSNAPDKVRKKFQSHRLSKYNGYIEDVLSDAIDHVPTAPIVTINSVQGQSLRSGMTFREDFSQEITLPIVAQHLLEPSDLHDILQSHAIGNVPTTPPELNIVFNSLVQQNLGAPIIPFPRSTEQLSWTSNNASSEALVTNNTKTKKNKWLGLVLRIGCTVLLFVFLFKSFSWSSLLGVLKYVDGGQLLVGFIVGLFCVVISAYQWRSLLHAEDIKFDLADLVDLYFIGIAFSHFLPTGMGGDAIKAMRVGDASGNKAGSASAVVMSRLTGFFGMLFIGIPVLLIWHTYFNQTIILWFFVLSILVAGMIGGAVFFAVMLPRIVKGKWITHKVFQSGIKIGKSLSVAMQRPQSLSVAILWGVIFWLCSCVNHYAYGMALGIHVPFFFYCVAVPFISLVTFLPISINGFGLREGAFVYIFSTMHISPATALLLALLMDAQALLFGSLGGCLYLLTGGTKAKNEKKQHAA